MIGQSIYSFNLKTFLQVVFTCALEPRHGLFTVWFALELSDVQPDDVSRLCANSAHRLNIFTSQKRQHFQLVSMYGRRGSTKNARTSMRWPSNSLSNCAQTHNQLTMSTSRDKYDERARGGWVWEKYEKMLAWALEGGEGVHFPVLAACQVAHIDRGASTTYINMATPSSTWWPEL